MSALNLFKSSDQSLMLLQKQWMSQLNPLLASILGQGNLLPNINLIDGINTFNHYLGRQMQGWFIVDNDANANIYRSAPLNNQTLQLTSSASCTINLWIF